MRPRLLSSALWAMAGNSGQYIIVFGLLVYLAHVLTPRDFGLMATVSVGLDIGTRVARWGQVELLQQERYRSDDCRNQSLRLSLLIGLLFAGAFLALAVPVGDLFHSRELMWMMIVCAPVFPFLATGSTAEAVLRSQFRFKVLAFRSTVSALIGAAVAIALAALGFGALTLAVQRLVQAAVSGLWIWTAVDWRPSIRRAIPWSWPMVREGASVMAGTLVPVALPRSIDLLVGAFLGPAMLGLMRVGFRVNEFVGQLVVMPLVSVGQAEFARAAKQIDAMRRSYLRLTQASALAMCPILIGLTWTAPEAIPLLFGDQWHDAVPFVEIIGLLGLVAPINYYFAATMVALGQSRQVVRQGLFQLALGVALTAGAAQISLAAVAWAHVLRGLGVSLFNMRDLGAHMGLRAAALGRALVPPYVATGVMSLALLGARMLPALADASPLARLLVLASLGAASYGATLVVLARAGAWPDHSLVTDRIKGMIRRRRASVA